jgi:hypothetical protein
MFYLIDLWFSHGGKDWGGLNSTDSSSWSNSDLDEAIVSPSWSPGVLDEVVVLTVFSSISNSEDSVVKVGSAGSRGENTSSVKLEHRLISLDRDCNWDLCDGSL